MSINHISSFVYSTLETKLKKGDNVLKNHDFTSYVKTYGYLCNFL